MVMPAMAEYFTIGDLIYDVTDTTERTVSVYAESVNISGEIAIPDKIEHKGKEYSVTAIGEGAFNDCQLLTSVVIPSSVSSINLYAFRSCS